MAKFTLTLESRHLYCGKDRRSFSELLDLSGHCEFDDDNESDNDFDLTLYGDSQRFNETVAYDTSETVDTQQRGTEISGTRTNGTIFTRSSGTWTVDSLIGWRVFAYVNGSEGAGSWLEITDNNATTVTITGTFPVSCNRIKLQPRPKLRHNIQVIPAEGFYCSFFKYKIEKKVPSSGNFKWYQMRANAIPIACDDAEFIAGMGTINPGWE